MTFDIAAILAVDGIASGAIYALVAIGTVLLFSVTRVMFVPFGDLAAFTALTVAALDGGHVPGTVRLLLILAALAFLMEATALLRAGQAGRLPRAALAYLAAPVVIAAIVQVVAPHTPPLPVRLILALALIVPVALWALRARLALVALLVPAVLVLAFGAGAGVDIRAVERR